MGATLIAEPADVLPHRTVARLLVMPHPVDAGLLVLLFTLAMAYFFWALGLKPGDDGTEATRLLHRFPFPRSTFGPQVWQEALAIVRTPQTAFAVLAVVPVLLGLRFVVPVVLPEPFVVLLAEAAVVVPFFVSIQSSGRTLASRWLTTHLAGTADPWIAAKSVACFVVPAILSVFAAGGLVLLDVPLSGDWLSLAGRVFIAYLSVVWIGALIPYSNEQSVSAAAAGISAGLVYLVLSTGVGLVLTHLGRLAWGMCVVAAILLLAVAMISRLRSVQLEASLTSS